MVVIAELLAIAAVGVAVVAALARVGRGPATRIPPAPARWEPHVAVVDNDTVVSVRRGDEELEIARIAGDDPDWHDKLLDARTEAQMRATALNAPD